jgi:hypothetical protein
MRVALGHGPEEMVRVCHTLCFLLDRVKFLLVDLEVHRYRGGFDGDTSLLFIWSSICIPRFTGLGTGNDTGFRDERVSEGGLSVIDWDVLV